MARVPFKLRSQGSSFKMMGSSSPVRRVDVLINDELEGTGAEARDKGRTQEKINIALAEKGKTKATSPSGKTVETKTVSYTGADALAKALEDGDMDAYRDIKAGHMGTVENPYQQGMQYKGTGS